MRVGDQARQKDHRVPRLVSDLDPVDLQLTPNEGYLLSRIDGHTSWEMLRQIGGLPAAEVDRCLEAWLARGWLEFERKGGLATSGTGTGAAGGRAERGSAGASQDEGANRSTASASGSNGANGRASASPAAPSVADGVEVDPSLDLDEGLQKELLELARDPGRLYHEILGVDFDADNKAIKKAYFSKSKRFHPDRYFRRNVGPFADLLELCFKRLMEAYELLSDPATRTEVQRSQQAAAAPKDAPTLKKLSRAEAARRLRRRRGPLMAHNPALAERKRKAKSFFEAGVTAYAAERWLEAAGSVRLAIAFDPGNAVFREKFAEVQRRANEEKAEQLVKKAESALELRDYGQALSLFEEAFHYRPFDGKLAFQAAQLAWQTDGNLKKAKELAMAACELEPEVGEYHRVLGQIYKAAGLAANAKREFDAALRIDPKDKEARAELRAL